MLDLDLDRRVRATGRALAAVAIVIHLASGATADEPSGDELPAEARGVLDRFLGQWTTQTHVRRLTPPAREFHTAGVAECRETLEGRFYEFRTRSIPSGEADLQVMTYDPEAGCYRQWVFGSDGYHHEATGTWDAATSTLHWTGEQAGSSFAILDHWVGGDRLEWTLRRTMPDGKLLQTIEGTLERSRP